MQVLTTIVNTKQNMEETKIISLQKLMIIIILIWGISSIISWFVFLDWSKSSDFADTFGTVNSLFSGLALAAIIYTIYLQKIELALQRKELEYTRLELTRTADAQEKTVFMMNEQLRLSNLPFLQYSSEVINRKDCLIIENESEHPAFDIDIWLFVTESEDEYPHKKFIEEWVSDKHKKKVKIEKLIDNEIWGISERGIYHSFPKNKKIIIPVEYEIGNASFEIFVQYRDNLGNNYSQKIWFMAKGDYINPFQDSIYEPNIPTVAERIDLTDKELTKEKLPEIANGLIDLEKATIFGSYLKNSDFNGVEYRWEMKNS